MPKPSLEELLQIYEDNLNQFRSSLVSEPQISGASESIKNLFLSVLLTRDRIQLYLDRYPTSSFITLQNLRKLDHFLHQDLKELIIQNEELQEFVDESSELKEWRELVKPKAESWWWFLSFPDQPSTRFDLVYSSGSIILLTISLGLFTNIITRFFTGGPDALGAVAIAAQGLLGLISAKGSLPPLWQELVEKSLAKRGVLKKNRKQVFQFGLAAVTFGSVTAFYIALPLFSNLYLFWGRQDIASKQPAAARKNLSRAIILNPDNVLAHYELGYLYEVMYQPDLARPEYQAAAEGGMSAASSNLSRLEILNKKYTAAVVLSSIGLNQVQAEDLLDSQKIARRYALHKNLGWARLGQGRYEDALIALREAVKFNPQQPAPYCLAAQVYEAQMKKSKALQFWRKCLQLTTQELSKPPAPRYLIDEDAWNAQAKECLKLKYRKQKCIESKQL